MARLAAANTARAVRLVSHICHVAGSPSLIDDSKANLKRHGVIAAVQRHDTSATSAIFNLLVVSLSYTGVADRIVNDYMRHHGRVQWSNVADALARKPSCPKLGGFQAFEGCGYQKGPKGAQHSCANPKHLDGCPLPKHDLLKGKLNQMAYSLFLFMRDVADGDVVGWLDERLAGVDLAPASDRPARLRRALLEPLEDIYGVGKKVGSMALSDLLLAADAHRPVWVEAGAAMIAIDTLVHNFLHRTGILLDFGAEHSYGAGCYAENGCCTIIERISGKIDARCFNPTFPANFPRFVQHAIWRFCARDKCDRCNGNRIDDSARCQQTVCPVFQSCCRVALKSTPESTKAKPEAQKSSPTKTAQKAAKPRRESFATDLMLSLGDTQAPERLRNKLRDLFRNAAGQNTANRRITYPGPGEIAECAVTWLPPEQLWAAFPNARQPGVLLSWFGCSLPKDDPITMAVEVNLSIDPSYRRHRGRVLVDNVGRLYLGHRGGLGGGRSGKMKISKFVELIKGFQPHMIARPGGVEESVFVIGTPEDADFLQSLGRYVRECARLRHYARNH